MTFDIFLVFSILLSTIILFALDRFRLDLIALLALLALLLTGILSPQEALAGFSASVVLMIAGLFVVGGAIFETGIADAAGRYLGKLAGVNKSRLVIVVMLASAVLSAFLSSTGTVAVMLPVVVSLARRAKMSPSKLLMPLAFASLLGGMLTLIGTPPNIVVSNQLQAQGLEPFAFFAFTPVGLIMLIVGVLFMLFLGQRLLPDRSSKTDLNDAHAGQHELIDAYDLRKQLFVLQLLETSEINGLTLLDADVRNRYGVNVISMESSNSKTRHVKLAEPNSLLRALDKLIVKGEQKAIERFAKEQDVLILSANDYPYDVLPMIEVLLPPDSSLVGKSLRDSKFRDRFGATVLAEKRGGDLVETRTSTTALRSGDTLLVAGTVKNLNTLKAQANDVVVVTETTELDEKPLSAKAPWVAAILLAMLCLMTFGWVANVTAVLLAAVAVVVAGALSMEGFYKTINWESVVLIAAILPVATALEKTGALDLIVNGLLGGLGAGNPYLVLLVLFLLTSLLSQVISNTATSVLVAPVAFQLASSLGLSPYPLLMTVAVAASTAFATPVASPVNALIITPGNYRFGDFLKIGVILQLLILVATLLVVPMIFPF